MYSATATGMRATSGVGMFVVATSLTAPHAPNDNSAASASNREEIAADW
jgi:hypothetical protein